MRPSYLSIPGLCVLGLLIATSALADAPWPSRVLLTNDNGIDDPGIVELARGLSAVTEVLVVAPATDRSGSSNFMGAVQSGQFEVEPRNLGPGITAYALDGYPADCVIFGLSGPLRESLPDLVISGINGGPNLGDGWIGSGTIGAARTAAYFGIPAIALSGLDDDDEPSVEAVVDWTVRFAQSDALRSIGPHQYLTVSFPVVNPWDFEGIEVVPRARGILTGASERIDDGQDGRQTWKLTVQLDPTRAAPDSDVAAAGRNKIAIVAMRADESDPTLHAQLRGRVDSLPRWIAPERPPEPKCRLGLGAMIDDAEDESGHEWGVLVAEILPGGMAEKHGLQAGDVIVMVNGESVVTSVGSDEDPVDVLVRVLTSLSCGDIASLDYRRGGEIQRIEFVVSVRD